MPQVEVERSSGLPIRVSVQVRKSDAWSRAGLQQTSPPKLEHLHTDIGPIWREVAPNSPPHGIGTPSKLGNEPNGTIAQKETRCSNPSCTRKFVLVTFPPFLPHVSGSGGWNHDDRFEFGQHRCLPTCLLARTSHSSDTSCPHPSRQSGDGTRSSASASISQPLLEGDLRFHRKSLTSY